MGALGKIIGTLGVELDTTFAHIRTQETNASNWIADVIRDGTGADVTILNSGTLRADEKIPPGPCMIAMPSRLIALSASR